MHMQQSKINQWDHSTAGSPEPETNFHLFNALYSFKNLRPQSNSQHLQFHDTLTRAASPLRMSLDRQPLRFSAKISQARSETSPNTTVLPQELCLPDTLNQLQQKIYQQILILREEKLTLMQEHNSVTQDRLRVQRELARMKKRQQSLNSSQEEGTSSFTHDFIARLDFSEQRQPMQVSKEDLQMVRQIECVREAISQAEKQINQLTGPVPQQPPPRLQKEQGAPEFGSRSRRSILRNRREKLLKIVLNNTPRQELRDHLFSLMESNQQLQEVIDQYMHREQHYVQSLKQKIAEQEQSKQQMLQDLIAIKSKSRHLQVENQQLRKALLFFHQ